jgi:hypothetical protein
VKGWVTELTVLVALILSVVVPTGVAAVLARVAVPLPLSLNVTPAGRVPVSVSAGIGYPVVFTVNVPAVPNVNAAVAALVIAGAWVTVCVRAPEVLVVKFVSPP